jgi:hypothetical protein
MENEGSMITDWLDKYGNVDIEKQVETKLFMEEIIRIIKETPNDMELGKRIREWYDETHSNKNYTTPYRVSEVIDDWYLRNKTK